MKKSILAFVALSCLAVFAADPSSSGVKSIMAQYIGHLTSLMPYMMSEKKFKDSQNQVEISKHLKQMRELSYKASHEVKLQNPAFKFSREVLFEHIAETERVFRTGNKEYARWMLNSTLSVCLSCHMQTPTQSRSSWFVNEPDRFTSRFEEAEFLFATRDFDGAVPLYDNLVQGYPGNKLSNLDLTTVLERTLAYHARIKRDPKVAIDHLNKFLENKKLPASAKNNIKAWIGLFREWDKTPLIDPKKATPKEVTAFAEKSLKPELWDKMVTADNPRLVTLLKVSGVLYEYLQAFPDSPATPSVLYWLAICDRGLANNFFFSLADLYLKECVSRYPKDPVAQKCYKEYEEGTIASYSGSSGTHLPEDVKKELKRLKSLLP